MGELNLKKIQVAQTSLDSLKEKMGTNPNGIYPTLQARVEAIENTINTPFNYNYDFENTTSANITQTWLKMKSIYSSYYTDYLKEGVLNDFSGLVSNMENYYSYGYYYNPLTNTFTHTGNIIPIINDTYYGANSLCTVYVSASSEYGAAIDGGGTVDGAWRAFDFNGNFRNSAGNLIPSVFIFDAVTGQLYVDFDSPKTISKYSITGRGNTTTQNPRNWTLQGSNNLTSWTTVHSASSQSFTANERKEYTVTTPNSYRYYRLNISANNGDANVVALANMELIEANRNAELVFSTTTDYIPKYIMISPIYNTALPASDVECYVNRGVFLDITAQTQWKLVDKDKLTNIEDLPSGKDLIVKIVLKNGQSLSGLGYFFG